MIPKVIHYCWFGGNEKPEPLLKCIESWKKFCSDYEIIEWNESNYDFKNHEFMSKAYENKKWAYVSDVARLDIIYNHGGIYLDTDVEIIRNIDELLNNKSFFGLELELSSYYVNTGLGFGAEQYNPVVKKMLDEYNDVKFINDANNPLIPCPVYNTNALSKLGLSIDEDKMYELEDTVIYPTDYFCPKNFFTGVINTTDNTYSIHHFSASWHEKEIRKRIEYRQKCYQKYVDNPEKAEKKISRYDKYYYFKTMAKKQGVSELIKLTFRHFFKK